jgi:hypothetical protein
MPKVAKADQDQLYAMKPLKLRRLARAATNDSNRKEMAALLRYIRRSNATEGLCWTMQHIVQYAKTEYEHKCGCDCLDCSRCPSKSHPADGC